MAPLADGSTGRSPLVDYAWAGAALHGAESGDLHVVEILPFGVLLAVIDGLGHGPEAALAAGAAASILHENAKLPVLELFEHCHRGLRGTRGAVMSLASLDARSSTIDWCGVGNVEGVLLRGSSSKARKNEALTARGGVVGYRLPPLKVSTVSVLPADVLIFATDGVRADFTRVADPESEPTLIAESILARCATGADDALVLVARYLGVSQ